MPIAAAVIRRPTARGAIRPRASSSRSATRSKACGRPRRAKEASSWAISTRYYAFKCTRQCRGRSYTGSYEVGSPVNRFSSNVVLWAITAGAASLPLPAWAAESKIAIVDFQKLGEESPQGKAVAESMRAEFAPRQRTLEAQQQSLKAKSDKLQKDGATMSEEQRNRVEKELR